MCTVKKCSHIIIPRISLLQLLEDRSDVFIEKNGVGGGVGALSNVD